MFGIESSTFQSSARSANRRVLVWSLFHAHLGHFDPTMREVVPIAPSDSNIVRLFNLVKVIGVLGQEHPQSPSQRKHLRQL
ncbi:hypothetical protein B0J13DRAFT_535078 [Dactylonectria estremocensis]|uniref:Uncharacterized protein n=1 Tax=Dactylonectria estremocensis TaxID=1079267 RepID=A0A9P9FI08_9HYPO|nr:hypothetical protein B0J13DRAFT_535078 [Dactylonectria estremocensis]